MPCIPIPKPGLPSIPDGLTLSVPQPTLPAETIPGACCILPPTPLPALPPLIPAIVLNAGVMAGIKDGLALVEDYFDSLPLDCPRS